MALNYQTTIVTTTPYTAVVADEVIFVNVISGPASVVLPTPPVAGRAIFIKDYSGTSLMNPITITAAGGKLINSVSFAMLNGGYSHIQVVYDGVNWMTIA